MRVVFLGTGEFACPALRALVDAGHQVLRAVSQPDRPAGRGRVLRPSFVHALADELGITHIQTSDVNALPLEQTFGDADIGVVAAFGQKIGPAILQRLPRGCVNIHGSLLPRYRGAAPYQWAIINGERETGVTVFQLNERWDDGPILLQRRIEIGPTETAAELHDRLAELGAEAIVAALAALESGRLSPAPQDKSQATRAPKLTREHSRIDWSLPARQVVGWINGLWSWPRATCVLETADGRRQRLALARAAVADEQAAPAQAAVGGFLDDLTVQAGRGRVRLLEVVPAGGKLMSFDAFARGRRLGPGARLCPLGQ